ncbi:cation-transporting P-type ATPase, partial [Candidatus Microgenomates bacterium]|nr:cation-transporting P-type ATPase [Candidatus Microgenomates bacterium]
VLVEATDLSINEAILTGESMPVRKIAQDTSFMGTTITTGIAKMVVTKTGMETEMGKIGEKVIGLREEKTPLQNQLDKLAKFLALVVGLVTVLIFILGEILGFDPLQMFTTSVAVAVAAIPEGLVVTLTVILSLGMQRILKKKALVRKLLAAETLGGVSVICCDKTGTLTEGKMQAVDAVTEVSIGFHLGGGIGGTPRDLLVKAAILCNDMRDPLEVAMMKFALLRQSADQDKQVKKNELLEKYPRIDEIPFSPEHKYIATLHKGGLLFVSGAPEVVLHKCKISNEKLKIWEKRFEEYGKKGYRLVGFAYKKEVRDKRLEQEMIRDLEWLGVLLFEDPIRKGVAGALKECQKAGIKVKVITGDYAPTAIAVINKLGILGVLEDSRVLVGKELEEISEEELKKRINDIVLFARVNPHQKLKIVKVLQENGEVVAMTGDGVNDAPALKKADIGIVVNDASDVARETADIVLLDSSFETIVSAIEEGRVIFENIKKVTLYLLADSFTEVILVAGSLLLGLPLPLTAAQILWVNLIEDGFPGIALAFEPKEEGLMRESPRPRKTPILDLEMKVLIFIIGIFTDLSLLGLLYFLTRDLFHLPHIQTIIFAGLAINSLFYIFSCRSLRKTIFHKNPFENRFLNFSVILGFLLLFAAIYLPFLQTFLRTQALELRELLLVFSIGIFSISAIEITKWVFIVRSKRVHSRTSAQTP